MWFKQLRISKNLSVEFRKIFTLAWPLILINVTRSSNPIVTTAFCGHLDRTSLAAATLATSFINVFGLSIVTGLCAACDTLFPQVFGSSNKKKLGIVLQRSLIILSLSLLVIYTLWFNCGALLLVLFRQNIDVVSILRLFSNILLYRLTDTFIINAIPSLMGQLYFLILQKYLQAQGNVIPAAIIGLIGNGINALLCYLFLFVFKWGLTGAAWASNISFCFLPVATLVYIKWKKVHLSTWDGWSQDLFLDWFSYMKLATAGVVMLCIEWWSFEVYTIAAGLLGTVALGAQGALVNTLLFLFVVCLGIGDAATVRVGNELGSNNPTGARRAALAALFLSSVSVVILFSIVMATKDVLARAFTTDKEVIVLAATLYPFVAACHIFDGTQCICGGIIKGIGIQRLGAIANFLGYCVFAIPIGLVLTFSAHMGLKGKNDAKNLGIISLWIGSLTGLSLQMLFDFIILARVNWENQAKLAMERSRDDTLNLSTSNSENDIEMDEVQKDIINKDVAANDTETLINSNENIEQDVQVIVRSNKDPWNLILKRRVITTIFIAAVFAVGLTLRFTVSNQILRSTNDSQPVTEIPILNTTGAFNV
ncbi:Multidrug and toxin extrusion protein 1 [Trichoplax sp. H2]|nr:Multidrug and toxin extrusion protein 1 [Trichoplax sp. H2]|eukprot:RDD47157.1 Multidrug and toxin extrusion protein 1 [Trichoplax sp. H2]